MTPGTIGYGRRSCLCMIGNTLEDVAKHAGVVVGGKVTVKGSEVLPGKVLIEINKKVGFRLLTKFGEKGVVTLAKFVPLVGGTVGGTFDRMTCCPPGLEAAPGGYRSAAQSSCGKARGRFSTPVCWFGLVDGPGRSDGRTKRRLGAWLISPIFFLTVRACAGSRAFPMVTSSSVALTAPHTRFLGQHTTSRRRIYLTGSAGVDLYRRSYIAEKTKDRNPYTMTVRSDELPLCGRSSVCGQNSARARSRWHRSGGRGDRRKRRANPEIASACG